MFIRKIPAIVPSFVIGSWFLLKPKILLNDDTELSCETYTLNKSSKIYPKSIIEPDNHLTSTSKPYYKFSLGFAKPKLTHNQILIDKIKSNYLYSNIEEYMDDLIFLNSNEFELDSNSLLDFYKIKDFKGNSKNFSKEFIKYILDKYKFKIDYSVQIQRSYNTYYKIRFYLYKEPDIKHSFVRWNYDETLFIYLMEDLTSRTELYDSFYIDRGYAFNFIKLTTHNLDRTFYISFNQFKKFNLKGYAITETGEFIKI